VFSRIHGFGKGPRFLSAFETVLWQGASMYLPRNPLAMLNRAAAALVEPATPVLAQMVVIRRCNLSCGYCNEYDDHSPPLPLPELSRRIDHLAALGTVTVTLTGGEPLMHPELDQLVARVVSHGMVCTTITNGYPVTRRWIERLNRAGLSWIQISIDNLEPNEVSQKSFAKIKHKLALLREHAQFGVNVNAVLGSCSPEATRTLVREVEALGLYMTVGLMHDAQGQLDRGLAGDALAELYGELRAHSKKTVFHFAGEGWERQMIKGGVSPWKCRAGSRYLYVDEFGKVSYCSQRRGEPGVDLLDYGKRQLAAAFHAPKGCEPSCTIACVRRASSLDEWRSQDGPPPPRRGQDPRVSLPVLGLTHTLR
jgi:MoaA/NifB/PqqE/SkfB family radical SAM enzyme